MKAAIAVFARAPVPGEVKTRLARHIGNEAAAELYAAMLRDTLRLARQAARSTGNCEVVVAYTPDNAFDNGRHSLYALWQGARLPQSRGDLGQRMLDCIAHLQGKGVESVLLVGSDNPDLPPAFICHAFEQLSRRTLGFGAPGVQLNRSCDVIFGPSTDGGFYLIGSSCQMAADLFTGVEWSSSDTLSRVLGNAARLQLQVGSLPEWNDVDTMADLRKLVHRLQYSKPHAGPNAVKTRHWLRSKNLLQSI